jgi:hypothetical protein
MEARPGKTPLGSLKDLGPAIGLTLGVGAAHLSELVRCGK